jgi:subfamily B ATP-binding cassette protein MsbA
VSKTPDPGGSLRLYRRLFGYAWPYRWAFLISVVGMLLFAATASGFAALMKPLVDEGFVQRKPEIMRMTPLLIVALFVVRAIANVLGEYTVTWIGRKVTYDLRNAVFGHLLRLPAGFYDLNASGTLISKLIFDVEQIAGSVTQAVFTVVRDGLTVVLLFFYMLHLNWKLTLLFVAIAPVSTLLIRAMSRGFRRTSHKIQLAMGEISQVAQEATAGQRVVKAFGGAARELRSFIEANERNRRQSLRKAAVSVVGMSLVQLLGAAGIALVIHFALGDPGITAGAFVSYIVAITWIMGPLRRLAKTNEVIQTGLAAAGSTFALLDTPPEPDSGTVRRETVRGRIEYRGVSFRYPPAATDALREISFVLEPGETLALVGASGSGKTTIASLLPRFYRVTAGEILLDDVNINDFGIANLRSHLAVVGQETLLFDDTVARNIAYGAEEGIDETRLEEAARAAHVLEFAQQLPQGLHTRVGEKGALLSGGQRQRVAIARALYKNAPVLILDEATSALDTESERLVQDAMRRLMQGRTTLVIAHRLSTVEHADRIAVLSQGRIVESGTHRELLARDGVYAGLYRRQFRDATD